MYKRIQGQGQAGRGVQKAELRPVGCGDADQRPAQVPLVHASHWPQPRSGRHSANCTFNLFATRTCTLHCMVLGPGRAAIGLGRRKDCRGLMYVIGERRRCVRWTAWPRAGAGHSTTDETWISCDARCDAMRCDGCDATTLLLLVLPLVRCLGSRRWSRCTSSCHTPNRFPPVMQMQTQVQANAVGKTLRQLLSPMAVFCSHPMSSGDSLSSEIAASSLVVHPSGSQRDAVGGCA
ncbi:hypothetical protein J3F83DRAFT_419691 [Trichoderma novae-zelandiae]